MCAHLLAASFGSAASAISSAARMSVLLRPRCEQKRRTKSAGPTKSTRSPHFSTMNLNALLMSLWLASDTTAVISLNVRGKPTCLFWQAQGSVIYCFKSFTAGPACCLSGCLLTSS